MNDESCAVMRNYDCTRQAQVNINTISKSTERKHIVSGDKDDILIKTWLANKHTRCNEEIKSVKPDVHLLRNVTTLHDKKD